MKEYLLKCGLLAILFVGGIVLFAPIFYLAQCFVEWEWVAIEIKPEHWRGCVAFILLFVFAGALALGE